MENSMAVTYYANRVFVGNLLPYTTEEAVLNCLRSHDYHPEDAKIIRRSSSGISKGFGFVDMEKSERGERETEDLIFRRRIPFGRRGYLTFKQACRKPHEYEKVVERSMPGDDLQCLAVYARNPRVISTAEVLDSLCEALDEKLALTTPTEQPPAEEVPAWSYPGYPSSFLFSCPAPPAAPQFHSLPILHPHCLPHPVLVHPAEQMHPLLVHSGAAEPVMVPVFFPIQHFVPPPTCTPYWTQ